MQSNNASSHTPTPKKKSRWHRWFFGVLYLVIVMALFGLFYNFVVRDERGAVSEDEEATTGVSKYDTLDVLGDYLWPGMKFDNAADDEDKEKDDKEKDKQQKAAPVIEAEAATAADIEEATGISVTDPAATTAPADNPNAPKVEQMEGPKVEMLE